MIKGGAIAVCLLNIHSSFIKLLSILFFSAFLQRVAAQATSDPNPTTITGVWKSAKFFKESCLQSRSGQDVIINFGFMEYGGWSAVENVRRDRLIGYYCLDPFEKILDVIEYSYDQNTGCLSVIKAGNDQEKFYCSITKDTTLKVYSDPQRLDLVITFRKFIISYTDDKAYFSADDYPFVTRPMFNCNVPEPNGSYDYNIIVGVWELKTSYESTNDKISFTHFKDTYCDIAPIKDAKGKFTTIDFIDSTTKDSTIDSIKDLGFLESTFIDCSNGDPFVKYKTGKKYLYADIDISNDIMEISVSRKVGKYLRTKEEVVYIFVRKSRHNYINHTSLFADDKQMKAINHQIENDKLWSARLDVILTAFVLLEKANKGSNYESQKIKNCVRCGGGGRLSIMNGDSNAQNGMACPACGGSGRVPD